MIWNEAEGDKLVSEFKSEYPDAYARWFLLEAIGLGIEEIGNELNEFIWARFGICSPMKSGGWAMREVIAPEARAFLEQLMPKLEEWQWRDIQRRMKELESHRGA